MKIAKESLLLLVDMLEEEDRISIILFDTTAEVLI
jgi:secreted protein with Ig-like and vWFA domain